MHGWIFFLAGALALRLWQMWARYAPVWQWRERAVSAVILLAATVGVLLLGFSY